ncbi:peroxisomal copper amine oxidase [Stygiomarasmius scandens]|uniref:Peroxisomal copper amine oxidase n=1 Tax=Marasmiellus scandens TaxID=2682957 RepID=A0ABR1JMG5_9AGAR
MDFDLEDLVHLEQAFYDSGYKDGFDHGRIHGLIEGRALGREKGFEMWEEIGFYEGFALMWRSVLVREGRTEDRAYNHTKHLLDLISQFPRINPSTVSSSLPREAEADIPKLFRQIRSRYKALCSTLGVRPSLRASSSSDDPSREEDIGLEGEAQSIAIATRVSSKKAVWEVNNAKDAVDEMSF